MTHVACSYDCAVAFTAIPSLQLPFQLSIISHHAELASKNTGVSAAALRMALHQQTLQVLVDLLVTTSGVVASCSVQCVYNAKLELLGQLNGLGVCRKL
jgi:hypothetical protein